MLLRIIVRNLTQHLISKTIIMKIVEIPKKETKVKRLFVPVTPSDHKTIMQYCKNRNVTLSDLIRFALKETFGL